MTACERLSDRIPEVARGRSRWTAGEAAHLATCVDCRAEWDVVVAVNGLGDRSPAARDPSLVAAAVLGRLADDRRSHRRSWQSWAAGLAAAAAIAAAVWSGTRSASPVEIALPELEPLETAELDSLLETMDSAPAGWSALGEPTLEDLDADELEQVLVTWEG
jgi:hypothetical protein